MIRAARAVPVVLAAAVAFGTGGARLAAQDGDGPSAAQRRLERATAAAGRGSFGGTVEVSWRDTGGDVHTERVGVRRAGGVLAVDGRRDVVAADGERYVETPAGWASIGGLAGGAELPDPGEEWEFRRAGDRGIVASRPTIVVVAIDRATGLVRQRFHLSNLAPYLVKREVLDPEGDVVRAFEFVRVRAGTRAPVTARPRGYERAEPEPLAEPPGDAPTEVGDGYELLGAYQLGDGVVQLFYSDGLFGVSVFVHEGDLDEDALPVGATTRAVGDGEAFAYTTPAGDVLVWQEGDDRVVTALSEAPPDILAGVAGSFAWGDGTGWWGRAAEVVLSPFAWR